MTPLEKKFIIRDIAFNKQTSDIFASIPNVMEAVINHLDLEEEAINGNLVWEDIARFDAEKEDGGFIMIVGVVTYDEGEEFELATGEIVKITEDNADYFKRVLRVGIPFHLAENGSIEAVENFLEDMGEVDPDDFDEILNNQTIKQELVEKEPQTEFNMDELTPEQQAAFELFKSSGK